LLEACRRNPLVTLVADAMVSGFTDHGDQVTVATEDGRSFEGDLLIGADGTRSRTREQLLADGAHWPTVLWLFARLYRWATSRHRFSAT
jgi:3-hydroxybenzoate 6-monooxygenase